MNEILLVILVFGLFSAAFWKHIQLAFMKFFNGNAFIKANSVLTLLALYILFYPELINQSMLIVVYLYVVLNLGLNGYFLFKTIKETKLFLPKGTRSIFVSIILLIMTPMADTLLNRDYTDRAAVLFAACTLAGALLNMWQVYLIHPDIRSELDGDKAVSA